MSKFADKWQKPPTPTVGERVKEAVRPPGPLKHRLEAAVRQIQVQITRLDSTANRLREKDSGIFNKVVTAIQKHDMSHASVYANELAEIRKISKMVTQAKVALEQIVLRLNTVQELGDIVVTLTPAMAVIRNVRTGLGTVLPEAEHEMGEINGLLSSILVDAGMLGGYTISFEAASEDAEKILSEASAVAEQRMKEKLPELPLETKIPTAESIS